MDKKSSEFLRIMGRDLRKTLGHPTEKATLTHLSTITLKRSSEI